MPAYAIFIRNSIKNAEEFAAYGPKAAAAGAGHPIKPLAFYGAIETLEGDPAEGVVLVEFPDMDAAKAWYNSDAYQDALKHRLAGADYRVLLVQGI
jgi:uncharacterized protein (DUF1330 family)